MVINWPVSIWGLVNQSTSSERIDGVDVVTGDTVLCVSQSTNDFMGPMVCENDTRENGLWKIGSGATAPVESAFLGMIVRIQENQFCHDHNRDNTGIGQLARNVHTGHQTCVHHPVGCMYVPFAITQAVCFLW